MIEVMIIADDLTGAADTGVQFLNLCRHRILLTGLEREVSGADFSGLALDTSSRNIPAADSLTAVKKAARLALNLGPRLVYKKIDSCLRGHAGQEIASLVKALRVQGAMVAPAYPALGRVTASGIHYVDGRPVNESEAACDPFCPVREARLDDILSRGHDLPVVNLKLPVVRRGAGAVAAELSRMIEELGPSILACDAETDQDLVVLAKAGQTFGSRLIMAGSAGLASAIGGQVPVSSPPQDAKRPGRPIIFFGGSASKNLRDQMEFLAKSGLAHVLTPDMKRLMSDPQTMSLPKMPENKDLALLLPPPPPPAEVAARPDGFGRRLTESFGIMTARLVKEYKPSAIFLSGSDTAKSAILALGLEKIWLRNEILPGMVLLESKGLFIIIKEGGFGDPMLLTHLYDA